MCFIEKNEIFSYLCNIKFVNKEETNWIEVALAEKKRTNRWLAGQMAVNLTTVSKWCINSLQPDLGFLKKMLTHWRSI